LTLFCPFVIYHQLPATKQQLIVYSVVSVSVSVCLCGNRFS